MSSLGSSSSKDSHSALIRNKVVDNTATTLNSMDPLIPGSVDQVSVIEKNYKVSRNDEDTNTFDLQNEIKFSGGDQHYDQELDADEFDIKYGAGHVIATFKPVVLCMLLVIISLAYMPYYKIQDSYMIYTPFHEKTNNMGTKAWQSVANASIVIVVIIIVTSIFVLLYKYRCMKIITGWLIFASMILMFVFFGIHLEQIFSVANIPIDYFSIIFCIWNFAGTGILVIHWKGPLRLHQTYLIVNSALFALLLIKYLPEWTTWVLLAFLSIWDLVAVLCPKGPLRALVEMAQERNDFFPSIIYSSTMVWLMTTNDTPNKAHQELRSITDPRETTNMEGAGVSRAMDTIVTSVASTSNSNDHVTTSIVNNGGTTRVIQPSEESSDNRHSKWHPATEEDRGVKIGLGDLVFYSVLVGKASSYGDWNTTLTCFVAILIGLCLTLILLAIYKMPLPALPISIFFGLLFYFTTSKVITPFLDELAKNNIFL